MATAVTDRAAVPRDAARGYGEREAAPAGFGNDGGRQGDPAGRRWRMRLAENVNLLHPRAKTVFAMRILDGYLGFRNPWARRLERHFGVRLPSALLVGLEPESLGGCHSCPSSGGCPREGMGYPQLARVVEEGGRLGIRLYVTAGGGAARYWPELLDLSLRHPDRTFLLFAGPELVEEAAQGRTAIARIGEEAAAAGNVGFVLPGAGLGRSAVSSRVATVAALLREAGAPFGFVSGIDSETVTDGWMEDMLEAGCLFGVFYPGDAIRSPEAEHPMHRLHEGAPIWILSLEEEVLFSGEAAVRAAARPRRSDRRPVLVVHPVTPRARWMTLLESIEAAPARSTPGAPAACPLELDRGDTRRVLYTIFSQAQKPSAERSRSAQTVGAPGA